MAADRCFSPGRYVLIAGTVFKHRSTSVQFCVASNTLHVSCPSFWLRIRLNAPLCIIGCSRSAAQECISDLSVDAMGANYLRVNNPLSPSIWFQLRNTLSALDGIDVVRVDFLRSLCSGERAFVHARTNEALLLAISYTKRAPPYDEIVSYLMGPRAAPCAFSIIHRAWIPDLFFLVAHQMDEPRMAWIERSMLVYKRVVFVACMRKVCPCMEPAIVRRIAMCAFPF